MKVMRERERKRVRGRDGERERREVINPEIMTYKQYDRLKQNLSIWFCQFTQGLVLCSFVHCFFHETQAHVVIKTFEILFSYVTIMALDDFHALQGFVCQQFGLPWRAAEKWWDPSDVMSGHWETASEGLKRALTCLLRSYKSGLPHGDSGH